MATSPDRPQLTLYHGGRAHKKARRRWLTRPGVSRRSTAYRLGAAGLAGGTVGLGGAAGTAFVAEHAHLAHSAGGIVAGAAFTVLLPVGAVVYSRLTTPSITREYSRYCRSRDFD